MISIIARYRIMILSSIVILATLVLAGNFLVAYMRGDVVVEASGRADVGFRVFYMENDIFPYNPIPQNLHFLMSFTDFIEVDSSFSAGFSDEVEIYYTYSAVKRLIIRYMATVDGHFNPIVFEVVHPLSEARGSIVSNEIRFPSRSSEAGGTYTIFPKEHIDVYLHFMAEQTRQMEAENVIAQNLRGFSAEMVIDFTYNISVPEWGIRETLTRGYHFTLSTEVYSLMATGIPAFDRSINLTIQRAQITLPVAIALVGALGLSAYGLFTGIKKLQADPNPLRQEAMSILKKYSNEIVVSDAPLPLNRHNLLRVEEFDALLKLAVNLNKHIMCYHNTLQAEFAVIVDMHEYYFRIVYVQVDEDTRVDEVEEIDTVTR